MEHVLCSVLFFVNRKKEKREKDLVTRCKVETGYNIRICGKISPMWVKDVKFPNNIFETVVKSVNRTFKEVSKISNKFNSVKHSETQKSGLLGNFLA